MIRFHRVDKNRPPMFFALSLVATLVGCGEGTDALNNGDLQAANAVELGAALPELGTPPTEISPSISAVQLLNDNTLTVGLAQAVASGEIVLPAEQVPTTVPAAVAAPQPAPAVVVAPVAPPTAAEPVTAVAEEVVVAPPAQIETPTIGAALPEETAEQEPTTVVAAPAPVAPAPAPVTAQPVEPEQAAEPVVAEEEEPAAVVETDTPTEPTIDVSEPPVAAAEPEAPAQETTPVAPTQPATDAQDSQTRFIGSTTPTFIGEIQDDGAVLLTWDVDPTARGYNVYRDAEYIQTVFDITYTDAFDAFDRNYYYEIQAFTADEVYSTIATGLTVAMTGTGRIDPNDPLPAEGLLDDYELVFSDEFNGTALDTSKWNTAYLWGDDLVINSELQHYVDIANDPEFGYNPFTFDGEALTINTVETPPELLERANGQEYLSGVITSYDAFQFTYGYVEARAQVPFGKGYWPAFWLLNAFYDQDKPEIDIMEFIGDNQDTAYHTFHYYDEEGNLRSTKSEPTFPIDFPAAFHTFGAEWSPGTVTFYVDGIARHTISDPKMSQEQMYIIANTAVGGWWPGDPDENTKFPGEYKIDYIRAYQRVGVQLDPPLFANPDSEVPVRGDRDFATPGHLPSFELFPEAYPEL